MTRPHRSLAWLVIMGVAAVLGALLWASVHALRLERSEAASRAEAGFQESIRLALWRMDSALAPLLTREAARPYFQYSAFYPADRAYTSMWKAVEPGEVLVPSPLLQATDPFVRLHFQIDDRGQVTSPQAPSGTLRKELEAAKVPSISVIDAEVRLVELEQMLTSPPEATPGPMAADSAGTRDLEPASRVNEADEPQLRWEQQQEYRKDSEFTQREYQKRQQALQNVVPPEQRVQPAPATETEPVGAARADAGAAPGIPDSGGKPLKALKDRVELGVPLDKKTPAMTLSTASLQPPSVEVGDMTPSWASRGARSRELVLTRTVKLATGKFIQGCWLDWPALKASLLSSIQDLFPQADLAPAEMPTDPATSGRLLAGIPAVILPGPPPPTPPVGWTPMRTTLAITWCAVLLTVNALAFAFLASRELAERRGRFVSAVTHELRTPLTTFTLYSQMLADGVVRDRDSQREYLGTLKRESQRLARIVENVLEYARLGKPGAQPHARQVSLQELASSVLPALRQRAEQSSVQLSVHPEALSLPVGVSLVADPVTVERILYNLVDNACKYAGPAPIELAVSVNADCVEFSVTDKGPGITPDVRRRLFRPFERGGSLEHAAISGLGLGLSLSRELARQLGGELSLAQSPGVGSRFVLSIRRARPSRN